MEMFDVFTQLPQLPFNMEDEVETIDLSTVNDFGGHPKDGKRSNTAKHFRAAKQADVDPDDEADPDWI